MKRNGKTKDQEGNKEFRHFHYYCQLNYLESVMSLALQRDVTCVIGTTSLLTD